VAGCRVERPARRSAAAIRVAEIFWPAAGVGAIAREGAGFAAGQVAGAVGDGPQEAGVVLAQQ
jgi:hypothetical protein